MSLSGSYVGLSRDCVEDCRDAIQYRGFGVERENRIRCCQTKDCNNWNATTVWYTIDWFKF